MWLGEFASAYESFAEAYRVTANFGLRRERAGRLISLALAHRAGMNLHINVLYGENEHHIIESIFKGVGRTLDQAITREPRLKGVRSSKGKL